MIQTIYIQAFLIPWVEEWAGEEVASLQEWAHSVIHLVEAVETIIHLEVPSEEAAEASAVAALAVVASTPD